MVSKSPPAPYPDIRGYALVTAMIFLVVLTFVALAAIRSTGLEMKMVANSVGRTEAFEASETPRTILGPLLDAHVFARGWPASAGGDVENDLFNYAIPPEIGLTSSGSAPNAWYSSNSEVDDDASYVFDPTKPIGGAGGLQEDATYRRNAAAAGTPAYWLTANLAVYKLRADIASGSGAAMVSGYEGIGKAAAAAGGNVFFYIQSEGRDSGAEARVVTGAVYRHVITN